MSPDTLKPFALALIVDTLLGANDHGFTFQLSLYDPGSGHERYCAFFEEHEERIVICQATQWDDESDDVASDFTWSSEIEEIASFKIAEDAAERLLELAITEGLLPRIIHDFSLEP